MTVTLPYAREPVLAHGGSNQLNLAQILVQPKKDFAMVLMTNVGGQKPDDALRTLAEELYKRFLPE